MTNSCINVNVTDSNVRLFCQVLANQQSDFGDSGSPEFRITNSPAANDVTLRGIRWGLTDGGAGSVFSDIGYIELELGDLTNCAATFAC